MNETIWRFDLGSTSIGFAIIEHDYEENTGQIKKLGVMIFPEGVTEKEPEPRNRRLMDKKADETLTQEAKASQDGVD